MKHRISIALILLGMFLITQFIGLWMVNAYTDLAVPYGMQSTGEATPGIISILISFDMFKWTQNFGQLEIWTSVPRSPVRHVHTVRHKHESCSQGKFWIRTCRKCFLRINGFKRWQCKGSAQSSKEISSGPGLHIFHDSLPSWFLSWNGLLSTTALTKAWNLRWL